MSVTKLLRLSSGQAIALKGSAGVLCDCDLGDAEVGNHNQRKR